MPNKYKEVVWKQKRWQR